MWVSGKGVHPDTLQHSSILLLLKRVFWMGCGWRSKSTSFDLRLLTFNLHFLVRKKNLSLASWSLAVAIKKLRWVWVKITVLPFLLWNLKYIWWPFSSIKFVVIFSLFLIQSITASEHQTFLAKIDFYLVDRFFVDQNNAVWLTAKCTRRVWLYYWHGYSCGFHSKKING